jgi:hypothetical protein
VSRLVYASGKPGSGKTSLAFPLAAELGYSLLTKDLIKETLHDALHVPGAGDIDREWSRKLGGAAMELLWALAARAGDMVIEANFPPTATTYGAGYSAWATASSRCTAPAAPAVPTARYDARPTHPVHVLKTLPHSAMAEYDRLVGIGSLVTVDTTMPVDIRAVATEVRRMHKAD